MMHKRNKSTGDEDRTDRYGQKDAERQEERSHAERGNE